jgi:hypothetical protein
MRFIMGIVLFLPFFHAMLMGESPPCLSHFDCNYREKAASKAQFFKVRKYYTGRHYYTGHETTTVTAKKDVKGASMFEEGMRAFCWDKFQLCLQDLAPQMIQLSFIDCQK